MYSVEDEDVVRTLSVPRRGAVDSVRFCGDMVAGLFYPERQSTGVIIWNWRVGKLIDVVSFVN